MKCQKKIGKFLWDDLSLLVVCDDSTGDVLNIPLTHWLRPICLSKEPWSITVHGLREESIVLTPKKRYMTSNSHARWPTFHQWSRGCLRVRRTWRITVVWIVRPSIWELVSWSSSRALRHSARSENRPIWRETRFLTLHRSVHPCLHFKHNDDDQNHRDERAEDDPDDENHCSGHRFCQLRIVRVRLFGRCLVNVPLFVVIDVVCAVVRVVLVATRRRQR